MKNRLENVSIVAFFGLTIFLFIQLTIYAINFFAKSVSALSFTI